MRLVQVISEYFPPIEDSVGGTQVHLRDLTEALRARGHEVEIFASLRGDEEDEYVTSVVEWQGVDVTRVTNNFQDVNRLESMYANPKMDARFRAFLHGKEPDLVHFHHLTRLSTTMLEVCRELSIPTVMTLHDYWMVCPRGKRYHPGDIDALSRMARTINTSIFTKNGPFYAGLGEGGEKATAASPSPARPAKGSPDQSHSVACGAASSSITSASYKTHAAKEETTRCPRATGIPDDRGRRPGE